MSVLTYDIDRHPYTGVRKVSGKLRVIDAPYIRKFFDGSEDYEQVHDVTIGKIYNVVSVEGLGDVECVTIIDDMGNDHTLSDFFFEEVPAPSEKKIVEQLFREFINLDNFETQEFSGDEGGTARGFYISVDEAYEIAERYGVDIRFNVQPKRSN